MIGVLKRKMVIKKKKRLLFIILIIVCIVIFTSGCNNSGLKNKDNLKQSKLKENNDNKEIKNEVLENFKITTAKVDMNNDGENETIDMILIKGKQLENSLFEGQFALRLYDANNILLDEFLIHGNYTDMWFPLNFKIKFEDYNNDGILDFNVGNESIYNNNNNNYTYKFFTLVEENKKYSLNCFSTIESCEKDYSYKFNKVSSNRFITYYYDQEYKTYEYTLYRVEDGEIFSENHINSNKNHKDFQKTEVKEKIEKILSSVKFESEKEILRCCKKEFNWLIENQEDTKIYIFYESNKQGISEEYSYLLKILEQRINKKRNLIMQFRATFDTKDIRKYSLEDIKKLKSLSRADDYKYIDGDFQYKEYDWKAEEKNYKLLAGGFHLDSFILLYDEEGKYLDGYVWTDKLRKDVNIEFLEKQNFVCVAPVFIDHGTGTEVVGEKVYEVYKGLLVEKLSYVKEGFVDIITLNSYSKAFKILSKEYDKKEGNLLITYEGTLNLYNINKQINANKKVEFLWDEEENNFRLDDCIINDFSLKKLYSLSITDNIFNENHNEIKQILQKLLKDDPSEDKGETINNIASFLIKCTVTKERDGLLKELLDFYEKNSDLYASEDFIKMIKQNIE